MDKITEIRIEEVVKEFIRERGRKPNSLRELKEFYEMRIGTAKKGIPSYSGEKQ